MLTEKLFFDIFQVLKGNCMVYGTFKNSLERTFFFQNKLSYR